jgi:hypothetical protein|tara:strand:- start:33 stop:161 length:129 start_codon:yes stop_codon:yes gene_type:complete
MMELLGLQVTVVVVEVMQVTTLAEAEVQMHKRELLEQAVQAS